MAEAHDIERESTGEDGSREADTSGDADTGKGAEVCREVDNRDACAAHVSKAVVKELA